MTIENAAEQTMDVASPRTIPISHQQVAHTTTKVHVEAAGRYAELMRVAFSTHQAGQQRAVLFTTPAPGAGVSFVSSAAAKELSTHVSGSILVVEAALLDLLRSEETQSVKALLLKSTQQDKVNRVSTDLVRRRTGAYPNPARRSLTDLLHLIRLEFDYIIIDAPALSQSDLALRFAADVDAVVLVVEANKTQAGAIASACRRLHTVNATVAGLVCNKRTYPIPEWLYKRIY
jgi:Mrp family chromosome partitioning ATPase